MLLALLVNGRHIKSGEEPYTTRTPSLVARMLGWAAALVVGRKRAG